MRCPFLSWDWAAGGLQAHSSGGGASLWRWPAESHYDAPVAVQFTKQSKASRAVLCHNNVESDN